MPAMMNHPSTSGAWSARFVSVVALAAAGLMLVSRAQSAESCGPAFNNVSSGGNGNFVMYEELAYKNKPDISSTGIKTIRVIDRGVWAAGKGKDDPTDPAMVRQVAQTIPADDTPVVLDFENYPLTGSDATVRDSIAKMNGIVDAFHAQAPGRRFGHYGAIPIRDYWRALGTDPAKFRAWQADNNKVAAELEKHVDVLFPSVYTFYDDRDGWKKYAIAQICEARRLSKKPVYAFLWPEYHQSNKTSNRFIDPDFWQMQLELARRYADGIVIWGGWNLQTNQRRDWDENAAWWQRTKEFAKTVKH